MLMLDRKTFARVVGEAAVIVVSILLALYADAWLDSRKQASHDSASRGVAAGQQLSTLMQSGANIEPVLAREKLWHLVFYEVFTPSHGAYEALIASGNLELLENTELKLELADFFGSFEDVRASERLQLDTQNVVFASDSFSQLTGWHRMGQADVPIAGDMRIAQWSDSDEFMSAVALLTVRQNDVLEDYEYLRNRIRNIAAAIESEVSE